MSEEIKVMETEGTENNGATVNVEKKTSFKEVGKKIWKYGKYVAFATAGYILGYSVGSSVKGSDFNEISEPVVPANSSPADSQ